MALEMRCGRKYVRIVVEPPGPRASEIIERDRHLLSPSFTRVYPLVVDSASDFLVRDVDGNTYIDFNSGIAVLNVGSTNPYVVERAKKQLDKFTHYSYTDFYYENIVKLAEELVKITPGSFGKKVYYGNSGAEAVEAAMKLARYHTKRPWFMAFTGAFHGRTMGALSLTASKPVQRRGFFPLIPSVFHIPYPYCYRCPLGLDQESCDMRCLAFVEEEIFSKSLPPDEVAAIFIEPIQGEGGYVVPPKEFLRKLRRLTDEHGILLVADEVQSGMGRTGRWFAIEHFGVVPDIITVAKAIAGGLPLSAMVSRADLMDWPPGSHATTFGANPVSVEAALGVIEYIREHNLLDNARDQGEYIKKRLREMMESYEIIGDVRGLGLMIGVEIVKNRKTKEYGMDESKEIVIRAWKKGLLLLPAGKSVVRIAPPLTIPKEAVDEGLEILESAIKEVNSEVLGKR